MSPSKTPPTLEEFRVRAAQTGLTLTPEDVDDVCSDAMVALLSSLSRVHESPAAAAIDDFPAFVAVIAYRACSEHIRRKYPAFHCLRNRLRYVLQKDPQLALWGDEGAVGADLFVV